MGLQTEHVLGLGAAIRIDGDLLAIAGALPASRSAAEHLAKNNGNRISAVVLAHQKEILVTGIFEVFGNVVSVAVQILTMTTGREVLTVIRIVVDCSTI